MKKQFKPRRRREDKGKPIIETIINTTALALTTLGVQQITQEKLIGFGVIAFGMGLEYLKYKGRKVSLW